MATDYKISYTNISITEQPESFGLISYDLDEWLKNPQGFYFYNIWIRTEEFDPKIFNLAKNYKNFYILFNDSLEGFAYITFKKIFEWVNLYTIQNKAIFVSGHLEAEQEYETWLNLKNLPKSFYVVSNNQWYERIRDQLITENIDIPLEKTRWMCCLNHRPHDHRIKTIDYIDELNIQGDVTAHWKNKTIDNIEKVCLPHSYTKSHAETLINITTETYYKNQWNFNNELFLSEKTWKPIVAKQIFVFIGPRGILKKLKSFGFETFEDFIDESYDDMDDSKRLYAAIDAVNVAIKNYKFEDLEILTRQIRENNLQLLKTGIYNAPVWKSLNED